MDSNKMFLAGLVVLGLFVIVESILTIVMPPFGDEPQGYALVATGIFIIAIVFVLARRDRKSPL
jgi:tetrahydromethanopterin S-methyltransferase subunit E